MDASPAPRSQSSSVTSRTPGLKGRENTASRPSRSITGKTREEHDRAMAAELRACEVDLVCLAGYATALALVHARIRGRILNIHPSLLPAFLGLNAQRQAIEYGVKFSGCTVHLVDEELDHGPIVKQAVVPVRPGDTEETLSARILAEEHRIYAEAVALMLSGRFRIEGRRVIEW